MDNRSQQLCSTEPGMQNRGCATNQIPTHTQYRYDNNPAHLTAPTNRYSEARSDRPWGDRVCSVPSSQWTRCIETDCSLPGCLKDCGAIQWFGNLSSCDVALQVRMPRSDNWQEVIRLRAGENWNPGLGALYFPQSASMRAVETTTGKMIRDLGEVGTGVFTPFVTHEDC